MTEIPAAPSVGRTRDPSGRPIANPPPIVFVGGTGRSGTHILGKLLGKHERLALVPVEVRFHVDEHGFPGLLAGEVSKDEFLRRLRGFWWRGFQTRRLRGLYRFVPQERFDEAVAAFERSYEAEGEAGAREEACRRLFYELLWFRVEETGAVALVEQSCDTVAAAPTLARLFPEARFIHVVRDGRDASASRVAQTHGLVKPRTRGQGLAWWEERIRRIDAGARAIPPERLLTMSLDELVLLGGSLPAIRPLCAYLDVYPQHPMKRYFRKRINPEFANAERWRRGISGRRAAEIERAYEEVIARLESDGVGCAPLLRRTLERSRSSDPQRVEPRAFLTGRPAALGTGT
jgi:Sulfotransferase family